MLRLPQALQEPPGADQAQGQVRQAHGDEQGIFFLFLLLRSYNAGGAIGDARQRGISGIFIFFVFVIRSFAASFSRVSLGRDATPCGGRKGG